MAAPDAPAAPLDAAVEEAREALGEIPPNAEDTRITSLIRCAKALRSLLAALDADRRRVCRRCGALATDAHFDDGVCMAEWASNGCDYADALRRLAEAEAALWQIDNQGCEHRTPCLQHVGMGACPRCIARRYFARREGEKGENRG